MSKPREIGNAAATTLGGVINRMAEQQKLLFDAATLLSGGDKQAALEALKKISDANLTAMQALMYLRTGQLRKAEDLLIDAQIQKNR